MKYAPYSFSRLSTFETCPQKFKFRYIDCLQGAEASAALKKGSEIHSLLEHYPDCEESQYRGIIQTYMDNLGKKYDLSKAQREVEIALDGDLKPCEPYSSKLLFRGFADAVIDDGSSLTVLDYKTGKYKEERNQDYRQLMFYALYFLKATHYTEVQTAYVYVEHNMENPFTFKAEYLPNYERVLMQMIRDAEDCTEFVKKTKFCRWCEYRDICLGLKT